jgi:hypothetical protein
MPLTDAMERAQVPTGAQPQRLSADRCRTLLAQSSSGHLALSQDALPIVVPVTCAVDGEQLFVRAGLWWGDRAPLPGGVAFETDGTTSSDGSTWEVMVQGRAEASAEGQISNRPPPLTLDDAGLTTVMGIRMEVVRGWQYGPAPWLTGPAPADDRAIATSQMDTSNASRAN